MTREDSAEKISGLASNAWFMIIGRAAMIVTLPTLGFLIKLVFELNTELRVLRVIVDGQMTDRYRAADAARDLALRDLSIKTLEGRIISIEQRLLDVKKP